MKTKTSTLVFILIASFVSVRDSFGADTAYEYPELMVTPRASDRLEIEAKKERERRLRNYLPSQISAVGTLTAGLVQLGNVNLSKDPNKRSPWVGIGVGAGWLVATSIMALSEGPYAGGLREVNELPRKSQREMLTRERFAESEIQSQAKVGRLMRYFAAATNLAASVYMVSNSEKNSVATVFDAGAIALSLTPVIFSTHWETVAKEQAEYKKRIYGPVVGTGVMPDLGGRGVSPVLALSFGF